MIFAYDWTVFPLLGELCPTPHLNFLAYCTVCPVLVQSPKSFTLLVGFCCCMFGCSFVYFVFPIFLVAFRICKLWRSVLLFYRFYILSFLMGNCRGVLWWICTHISSNLVSCCYLMVWGVCFFFGFVVFVFVLGWSRIHLDFVRECCLSVVESLVLFLLSMRNVMFLGVSVFWE